MFALPRVVPSEILQHLSEDNGVIVPHLLASIGGVALYRERNVLDELVRRSLALVIDRNLAANADRYGKPQFGSHLERYLVDALRRLASGDSNWTPNREKSRVWYGPDGLFLLWPSAAEDVHQLLDADQLPGIPKAPETMLELLLAAGVFTAQDADHATWNIRPPGAKSDLDAVRLASPTILFTGIDIDPAPLAKPLFVKPGAHEPGPSQAAGPTTEKPGTQLSLIPPPSLASQPESSAEPVPTVSAAISASRPPFALRVPMRMNPVVRDALVAIVASLNDKAGSALCCTVAQGVFVPLIEFERRSVPPALALRSLADVRVLVRMSPQGPPTLSRDFNGTPTIGLVIDPRCVDGLDLDGFVLPSQQES